MKVSSSIVHPPSPPPGTLIPLIPCISTGCPALLLFFPLHTLYKKLFRWMYWCNSVYYKNGSNKKYKLFQIDEIREILTKMTVDFREKFSEFRCMYFRPHFRSHFRENFRLSLNIETIFGISRIFYSILHQEEWLSWLTKRLRVRWGKNVFSWKYIPLCKYTGCPKLHY